MAGVMPIFARTGKNENSRMMVIAASCVQAARKVAPMHRVKLSLMTLRVPALISQLRIRLGMVVWAMMTPIMMIVNTNTTV